ncbi:hypothetical protein JW948_07020 [bacterium]|nr:hypothetical protein [bacterium]
MHKNEHVMSMILAVFLFNCSSSDFSSPDPSTSENITSPVIFAGDGQKIRAGEYLNEPYAYPIVARSINSEGDYINNQTIYFSLFTGAGTMPIGQITTSTYTDPLSGIVYPGTCINMMFSSATVGSNTIEIKHNGNSKYLEIEVINDEEVSVSVEHEKISYPSGSQIPGDGFHDPAENTSDQSVKNVYIELDFAESWIADIDDIINEAGAILQTGGFEPTIIKGDILYVGTNYCEIRSIYSNNKDGRKEMKALLKDTRTNPDAIHAILALDHGSPGLYGITIQYFQNYPVGDGYDHFECFYLATGKSDWDNWMAQNHKDSTGVFVFTDNIPTTFSGPGWSRIHAIACILSHEIGHALGISSHHNFGVMDNYIDWSDFYANYNHFDVNQLQSNNSKQNSINTRDILGRDTVDFAN